MYFDVVVIGAGLAGSVSARDLAEKGKKVLVVEQHKHIGGHCHDFKNDEGITIHTYGPHIFHTIHKDVWDYVNRFTEFRYFQHRVLSYANGQLIPFPINRDTINKVYGSSITTNDVKDFLAAEVEKSKFNNPPKNFRDAVVSQVGETLYEMFFKNYTIKQWERDPEELSAEVARRIPVRENRDDRYFADQYQGIPIPGYTSMVEQILNHENISLMLGVDYFKVQDDFKADLTIYTGELDRFFDYKYGKLEYRSLDLVFKTLDKEWYQDVSVVNYPNDYDWTRITEYKHLTGEKSSKTTVSFEYPKATGEPFYIVMTKENMEAREKYMKEVEALEQKKSHIFIGRLAEYKYYNMDQVIKSTLEKIRPVK